MQEETVRKAESELRAAVDDLKNQQDAYVNQMTTLEQKSKDMSVNLVQRNKAAAEFSQLKQQDPLPLSRAKITQEASLRKVEKERKRAESLTSVAEGKAKDAQKKVEELEELSKKVEQAYRDTEARVQEAQAFLEEVKKKGGVPRGAIWWVERELTEAQKYLPKRKQK